MNLSLFLYLCERPQAATVTPNPMPCCMCLCCHCCALAVMALWMNSRGWARFLNFFGLLQPMSSIAYLGAGEVLQGGVQLQVQEGFAVECLTSKGQQQELGMRVPLWVALTSSPFTPHLWKDGFVQSHSFLPSSEHRETDRWSSASNY